MRLLAIDLGSRFVGWAYFRDADLLSVGVWDLSPGGRTQSPGVRWLRMRAALDEVLDVSRLAPDLVAYEEVVNHVSRTAPGRPPTYNTLAAHAYGAAEACLLAWAETRGLQYTSVPIAAIKRAALGKGGGKGTDKAAVLAAAQARWPHHRFEQFDAADAAFIGVAALIDFGVAIAGAAVPPPASASPRRTKPKGKEKTAPCPSTEGQTGTRGASSTSPQTSLFSSSGDRTPSR